MPAWPSLRIFSPSLVAPPHAVLICVVVNLEKALASDEVPRSLPLNELVAVRLVVPPESCGRSNPSNDPFATRS